jgi:hypothetical protein
VAYPFIKFAIRPSSTYRGISLASIPYRTFSGTLLAVLTPHVEKVMRGHLWVSTSEWILRTTDGVF